MKSVEDEKKKNYEKGKKIKRKPVKRNCGSTFDMSELISRKGNLVLDTTNFITCMCGDIIPFFERHTNYTLAEIQSFYLWYCEVTDHKEWLVSIGSLF